MNRKALLIGALVAVPLLVVLGLALGFDPRRVESPLVGAEAPAFRLQSLDGEIYDLRALRGTPVVLNFWSTWCPPCLEEHPLFAAAAQRYEGRVQFLGVIYQDDPEKIRSFGARWGVWDPRSSIPRARSPSPTASSGRPRRSSSMPAAASWTR